MSHNPYQQYPGYPGTPPQGQGDYPASYPAPAPGYPQQQGYYAGQRHPATVPAQGSINNILGTRV